MANKGWLEEGQLLANAGRLKDIPAVIVQGRYDAVCPIISADDLHRACAQTGVLETMRATGYQGDAKPVPSVFLGAVDIAPLDAILVWTAISIPLTIFVGPEAKPGQGLVAFGSNHGNEYEGVDAAMQLIERLGQRLGRKFLAHLHRQRLERRPRRECVEIARRDALGRPREAAHGVGNPLGQTSDATTEVARTSATTRFESVRFTEFASIAEAAADLEELIRGTNPANSSSAPTNFPALDLQQAFDLVTTPRSINATGTFSLSATGGAAHPTGYPLFVLWLRATSWLPGASVAHTAALSTAVLGGLGWFVMQKAAPRDTPTMMGATGAAASDARPTARVSGVLGSKRRSAGSPCASSSSCSALTT